MALTTASYRPRELTLLGPISRRINGSNVSFVLRLLTILELYYRLRLPRHVPNIRELCVCVRRDFDPLLCQSNGRGIVIPPVVLLVRDWI